MKLNNIYYLVKDARLVCWRDYHVKANRRASRVKADNHIMLFTKWYILKQLIYYLGHWLCIELSSGVCMRRSILISSSGTGTWWNESLLINASIRRFLWKRRAKFVFRQWSAASARRLINIKGRVIVIYMASLKIHLLIIKIVSTCEKLISDIISRNNI